MGGNLDYHGVPTPYGSRQSYYAAISGGDEEFHTYFERGDFSEETILVAGDTLEGSILIFQASSYRYINKYIRSTYEVHTFTATVKNDC